MKSRTQRYIRRVSNCINDYVLKRTGWFCKNLFSVGSWKSVTNNNTFQALEKEYDLNSVITVEQLVFGACPKHWQKR